MSKWQKLVQPQLEKKAYRNFKDMWKSLGYKSHHEFRHEYYKLNRVKFVVSDRNYCLRKKIFATMKKRQACPKCGRVYTSNPRAKNLLKKHNAEYHSY